MSSLLPSALVLGSAALAALFLVGSRWPPVATAARLRAAARSLVAALSLQCAHFAEEAATGFPRELADATGLLPMPFAFFVIFNVGWIGVWIASVPGLSRKRRGAFFAAWFLAIAGTLNGVAHPLLALAVGGYFPGLVSAPLVAVGSIWLGRRLLAATAHCGPPTDGRASSARRNASTSERNVF